MQIFKKVDRIQCFFNHYSWDDVKKKITNRCNFDQGSTTHTLRIHPEIHDQSEGAFLAYHWLKAFQGGGASMWFHSHQYAQNNPKVLEYMQDCYEKKSALNQSFETCSPMHHFMKFGIYAFISSENNSNQYAPSDLCFQHIDECKAIMEEVIQERNVKNSHYDSRCPYLKYTTPTLEEIQEMLLSEAYTL